MNKLMLIEFFFIFSNAIPFPVMPSCLIRYEHRKLKYALFVPRDPKAVFAQCSTISRCSENYPPSSRKDRNDNATLRRMTAIYITISQCAIARTR